MLISTATKRAGGTEDKERRILHLHQWQLASLIHHGNNLYTISVFAPASWSLSPLHPLGSSYYLEGIQKYKMKTYIQAFDNKTER